MEIPFVVLLTFFQIAFSQTTYPATFGTALSQGLFKPEVEYELYSHNGQGLITYFWCTEDNDDSQVADTIFRIYVDGSSDPLEFTLDLLVGIGFEDPAAPWGTSHFGKGAATGGVYSTMRIPFGSSIRITGLLPKYQKSSVTFWWIVRGVSNFPLSISGYDIPSSARLKLYKSVDVTLNPLEYLTLVKSENNGAVWMVTLAVKSTNLNYLEGCVRMYIGPSKTMSLLSSGTEDYFQSAFYFDAGSFHLPEAGLTHQNSSDGTLSAYKVHEKDVLFFHRGGFIMTWRNGDYVDPTTGFKCVDSGTPAGNPQKSVVTSYTWVYEWN